ncbi:MAG: LysR family transcriptional regulator [Burkholderiales bacterium]
MDPLSDIAVFVRVVERSSFTRAAEDLELSKAVVSKYLTRLEERLGARLLNRSTRRLSLTEAGSVLFERSRLAIERIEEAQSEVARFQSAPRGRLAVSAPMAFGVLHLGRLLPDFLRAQPGVSLDMRLDDRFVNLVAEGFDMAIRIGALTDSTLVARKLAPCRQVVCASPAYVQARGAPREPADLAAHNCFVYSYAPQGNAWRFSGREGREATVAVTGNLRLNNGLLERDAALAGAGIARLPTFYVGPLIREGRLVALLPGWKPPELGIYAVYPQRQHVPPKVRAFVDFLVGRFGPKPDWDLFEAPAAGSRRPAVKRHRGKRG